MIPQSLSGRSYMSDEIFVSEIYQTRTPGKFEFPDPKERFY